jgi:regulatory protein
MIYITRVERKGKKVNLTFSNSTNLKLNSEVFKKYNFVAGEQIDEEKINKLRTENDYFEAKISALRFLSIRNHSYSELWRKLIQKKFSEEVVRKVLDELDAAGYINDRKFAEQFFDELLSKFFGPLKIKNEMLKRGIDRKLVDEIVQVYFNDEDLQVEKILKYLQKNKFPQKLKKKSEIKKIYNHLAGRGFSSSAIMKSLKTKFGNELETAEDNF